MLVDVLVIRLTAVRVAVARVDVPDHDAAKVGLVLVQVKELLSLGQRDVAVDRVVTRETDVQLGVFARRRREERGPVVVVEAGEGRGGGLA